MDYINKLLDLYVEKSISMERRYAENKNLGISVNDSDNIERKIKEILPNIPPLLNKVNDFIKYVKKLISEKESKFSIAFSVPFLDEFVNALLFDLRRYGFVDENKFKELKEKFSKQNVEVYI